MISFRDVSFRYPEGETLVLNSVNLQVPEGAFLSIMGANGSGKTTLARCMNGLLLPTSGNVLVDDMNTKERTNLLDVRKRVGMVLQDPHLQFTSLTVEREIAFGLENLAVPQEEMHERVGEQLRLFDLEKQRHRHPSSLSGGEKQRLALAAIMVMRPCYMVLDEATSLLSSPSRKKVIDMVMVLRASLGIAVVLITQFPSEAVLTDRLVVLDQGKVLSDGSPTAAFRHAQDFASMGITVPLKAELGIENEV